MAKLVDLQFQFKYKKGSENSVVDALSRINHSAALQAISVCKPDWVQEVLNSYTTDTHMTALLEQLTIKSSNEQGYSLVQGLIRYKGRLVLGENLALQTKLLSTMHNSAFGGHSGIQATY
jgi:hypothetical protein